LATGFPVLNPRPSVLNSCKSPIDGIIAVGLTAPDAARRYLCAIVYATALAHGGDLLTCDRHFKNLPGVQLVPKTGK